jgi:NAD(P)-dependent dehydrogenase (short-subunit alcohol dehydrogenase family)
MTSISGKVVLITGATGNLGRAVAFAFQEAGARMILVGRSAESLSRTFEDLSGSPDYFLIGDVDLTNEEDVREVARSAYQRFRHIDVLVNTVGTFRGGKPVHEEDMETWDFLFKVNLNTTLLTCRAVIPYMIQQNSGRIINTASRSGLLGSAGYAAYSASKSAVIRLTEGLAKELSKNNVNVNCIMPGTIDTPQNRQSMPDADYSKWVDPAAIADVVLFLASDAARSVTGAAIPVYGKSYTNSIK